MTNRLKLGTFEIPKMSALHAAFGAEIDAYPPYEQIPEEYRRGRGEGCKIAMKLFFEGGKLSDHGRAIKAGVDEGVFYTTLRAYLCSWAPKHEHKEAASGWLIDAHTDAV
ncbi:hypothetical protein VWZ88_01685 [Phaeobacter sp. JH20_36]|uniref:hypothetical protein n=1 Tax=unclassified Phaeobacter TaxID=2621772 RepID=UPI003A884F10